MTGDFTGLSFLQLEKLLRRCDEVLANNQLLQGEGLCYELAVYELRNINTNYDIPLHDEVYNFILDNYREELNVGYLGQRGLMNDIRRKVLIRILSEAKAILLQKTNVA